MLPDTPIEQRAQILKDSCDQIVERSYTKKFDQPEINQRRAELSKCSLITEECHPLRSIPNNYEQF